MGSEDLEKAAAGRPTKAPPPGVSDFLREMGVSCAATSWWRLKLFRFGAAVMMMLLAGYYGLQLQASTVSLVHQDSIGASSGAAPLPMLPICWHC